MPSVSLPIPPSVNKYWLLNAGSGLRIAPEGMRFREATWLAVQELGVAPIVGDVRIHIDVWWPDGRRRDLDNALKALLDALAKAGAYADDDQIADLRIVRKGIDRDDPRVEVHWEPMEERR